MPKPTKLPRARVGCVRFNDLIGSMHLTAPGSVVAHKTDVVHYALVKPMPSLKSARQRAKFENLSAEDKEHEITCAIMERRFGNPAATTWATDPRYLDCLEEARTALAVMEGRTL